MKKLLLTLAAVAMMIPAMAAGGQKNLFLELRNSRIFYKDADISLEQLQEIITGDVYYDNILVVTDLSSQAYMMFGIKDAVEQKTSAQLVKK